MTLKAILHPQDGGYWAEVPSLPGCYTQGRTLKEVKANLAEAIEVYLETRQEEALAQKPKHARIEEVAV